MVIELTEAEIQILRNLLTHATVDNIEAMRALVSVFDKLTPPPQKEQS